VGLYNRGGGEMPITVFFRDISVGDTATIRDLWLRKDLGVFHERYTATVPSNGVVLLKVK
jgi:alpha-galactosidase